MTKFGNIILLLGAALLAGCQNTSLEGKYKFVSRKNEPYSLSLNKGVYRICDKKCSVGRYSIMNVKEQYGADRILFFGDGFISFYKDVHRKYKDDIPAKYVEQYVESDIEYGIGCPCIDVFPKIDAFFQKI